MVGPDLDLGTRRARAAALLTLALPGAVYLYQGEELGLWEDPIWLRNGGIDPGRDGCRVPMPWSGSEPPFGFSPDGAAIVPWLPQPSGWHGHTVAAETGVSTSMLELYRAALRLRRSALRDQAGPLRWLLSPDGVLAFQRGEIGCVVNLSAQPAELPGHGGVLLASEPLPSSARTLPADTAAWLRLSP